MPWFEVKMTALHYSAVEADSEEQAMKAAQDEYSSGDYEFVEAEATGPITNPASLESLKRHANGVLEAE